MFRVILGQAERSDTVTAAELIVIGTDGIWEARDTEDRFFGNERFKNIIRKYSGCTAHQMLNHALGSVQRFCQGGPFADDETLVVIQKKNTERGARCPAI